MSSNRQKKIGVILALCFLGSSVLSPLAAEDAVPEELVIPKKDVSYSGEAGKALMGRVFGGRGQGGDIDYYAFDLTAHTRFNAGFRSFFIPGWGQAFNGEKRKGMAFFITTVGALGASIYLYGQAQDSYDLYKKKGVQNGSDYDDYEAKRTQSIIMGSVAAVLWIANIVDANRNALNPLWSKNGKVEFTMTKDQTGVHYKHRF